MSEVRIAAEPRAEFGKGAARRIRRADKVPAVVYGHGAEPTHLSLPGHALMIALRTPNVLIRLEGQPKGADLVLPKAIQRDPIKGFLKHVDLLLVKMGEKVSVEVPIELTGEITPGGILDQQLIQIAIQAEATHIPQSIEVSVEGMDIGDAVHAADLKLPSGSVLEADPEALVVHVTTPAAEEPTEEEAAEEGEAAEGEAAEGEGDSAEASAEESAE